LDNNDDSFCIADTAFAGVTDIFDRIRICRPEGCAGDRQSAYQSSPRLPNPENDASAIGQLLKNTGFDGVEIRQTVTSRCAYVA